MEIIFGSNKLSRIFSSERRLVKEFGAENARIIMRRMGVLQAAPTLDDVHPARPERRHQLKGDRKGEFAVDLKYPRRLILRPAEDKPPRKADGGIDLRQVTSIIIIGVEDYH